VLPNPNRLKKNKDIQRVFEKGKSFKQDFLILKTCPNNLNQTRFAFVVSQKSSKKAVVRNKLKRRIREIVGTNLSEIKKGMDVVVIVLSGLETKDFQETEKTLNKLFQKAEILITKQ